MLVGRQIPFSKPCFNESNIEEFTMLSKSVLESGWLTSYKFVKEFEEEIKKITGSKYCVAVNSCTAALHLILRTIGVKEREEVLVPSNTFTATVNAVLYVRGTPRFVDSDPGTFNISVTDLQEKISRKTKAVMVVHLGGNPCDMKEIIEIASDYGALVVEDAAHALGSTYKGRSCGSLGIAGAFSFYPTKIVTTGEGGVIITDEAKIARRAMILRNHGRDGVGSQPIIDLGYNYRMPELSAAIGIIQLKRFNEFLYTRKQIAKIYDSELSKISWIVPQKIRAGNKSSYYAYIVRLLDDAPMSRDRLREVFRENRIGTSILYKAVHLQPFYRELFGTHEKMLPVAEQLERMSLALPIYGCMSREETMKVIKVIRKVDAGEI